MSIETSAPQQARGFIINVTLESQMLLRADRKRLLLAQ